MVSSNGQIRQYNLELDELKIVSEATNLNVLSVIPYYP